MFRRIQPTFIQRLAGMALYVRSLPEEGEMYFNTVNKAIFAYHTNLESFFHFRITPGKYQFHRETCFLLLCHVYPM